MNWEPSKIRYYFGRLPKIDRCETYISQRSLFLEDVDSSLNRAYEVISKNGTDFQKEKSYGYKCYDREEALKLQLLIDIVEKYKRQSLQNHLGVKTCLSDRQIQIALESIQELAPMGCCNENFNPLLTDTSGSEEWKLKNPWCVARENWEKLSYQVCDDLKIKVSTKEIACDLVYTITSEEVDCTLAYAIESYKKDCNINFNVSEETWEESGCQTPYEDCKRLSACGISFDMIAGMNKCGIEVEYNYKDKCPLIKYEGKTVNFKDINLLEGFNTENWCNLKLL